MTVNKAIEAFKRSNIDIDESWLIVPLVNNELCQDFILFSGDREREIYLSFTVPHQLGYSLRKVGSNKTFSGTCKEYDMYTVSKIQKERSDDITYVHLDQSLKL